MKRLQLLSTCLLLMFSGCSESSPESDAKRVAEIHCRAQSLLENVSTDDSNNLAQESIALTQEAQQLYDELAGKYESKEDLEIFTKTYLEEVQNCN